MSSFSTLTERVDIVFRMIAAYLLIALLFFLNIVAVPYPLTGEIKAPLFLMAIYYWAVYRPTLLPGLVVFIAGALMDLLSGLPLGLNALMFVVAQWVITDQRRFLMGQSFVMIWSGFTLLALGGGLLQWSLFGVLNFHWPPMGPLLVSSLLGAALFPIIYILLHLTHKLLPSPSF